MSKLPILEARLAVLALRRQCASPEARFCLAAGPHPRSGRFSRGTHVHDSWELKFAMRNVMTIRFPGHTLHLKAPTCCLIAPGTPHETSNIRDVPRSGRGFVMCRDGDRFDLGPVTLNGARRRAELEPVRVDRLSQRLGEPMDLYLERMVSGLSPYGTPVRSRRLRSGVAAFLSALADAIPDADPRDDESPADVVARTEAFLRSRYYDPELTVEDAAQSVGRTATHLAAMFRKHRQRSVRASLITIRLAKAREFLRSGQYSVKEVSHLTGWGSQYYFSNSFLSRYGDRPSWIAARAIQDGMDLCERSDFRPLGASLKSSIRSARASV